MRSWRVLLILTVLIQVCWQNVGQTAPPKIDAEAACLIVAGSQQMLYEKNGDKVMYPASTTKIVTLITALEKGGKLEGVVEVGRDAAGTEGSSMDLQGGERLTLRELLYGMMLVSGNDAAEAVARYVGGSRERFVALMNETAHRAGAGNTHFSNPHGLPDPYNHFTTAHDMALITAMGYKYSEFSQIVASPRHTLQIFNQNPRLITNTNRLLTRYPGANGVKTGYTEAAGECLVAAARRGGVQLIAVVFKSERRWDDAAALLDYGFSNLAQRRAL